MRIWFNHWFSTAWHLIEMMKAVEPGWFTFIGSSTNRYALYGKVCDAFFEEPADMDEEGYAAFCLGFCRAHGVDVFVPRRHQPAIVAHAAEFAALGVKLMAPRDAGLVREMDDKAAAYARLGEIVPARVPEHFVAGDLGAFERAVAALQARHGRVCYKLTRDEGARSFRVIDEGLTKPGAVYNKPGNKLSLSTALSVMENYDFGIPVLVMPYLPDVEISVDCLRTSRGAMIIPRYKTNKRYSEVIFAPDVMDECRSIMDALGLDAPANIQYKTANGERYLLEINTRMSGGLQLSCKASGLNLPAAALYELLGEPYPWAYPAFSSAKVAHLETPVCL